MNVEQEQRPAEQMAVIIRRILAEADEPLTFEELEDRIDSEVQAGIRHLIFHGGLDKGDRVDKINRRVYSLSESASKGEQP